MGNQRATSIFFVRHGQTEWNNIKKVQGQLDIPLSETGIIQAQEVAKFFATHIFDTIMSSDLQRAIQTATIINEYHKHTIKLEPLLREQHYGIAQGLLRDQVPLQFAHVSHKPLNQPEPEYHVPQAETYAQLVERAIRALERIVASHGGQTILIVAHDKLIRSIVRYSLNNHSIPVEIENCGIVQFHHETQLVFQGFIGGGGAIGEYE